MKRHTTKSYMAQSPKERGHRSALFVLDCKDLDKMAEHAERLAYFLEKEIGRVNEWKAEQLISARTAADEVARLREELKDCELWMGALRQAYEGTLRVDNWRKGSESRGPRPAELE